ncbi:guanylate kinase [Sediminibacterium sp. TEGAF015]|uniref:guanylate kinase n=1 Tax=Sediminibacterium sp. TEGAF015 TaxID=575378 RepID=UPI00220D49CD|nr:guanylate kinase [Sediminibacterium sp. TEGAF015]BDQ12868.1 guanylate kinase [Sediminibacterium sp. TEGAF015]
MGADTRKIIIIAAPSGSGKTSITRYLLQQYPLLSLSISAATRKPRGEEKDGVHYHFISEDEFKQKIEENAFVEWEMVYEGSYYGTLKAELERIWNLGKVPILDIDVKGAIHLQDQFPHRCLSIFIEPPSVEELKKRLESRGTETPESLANRVNKASYELSFKNHFHKNILNDNLEKACRETEVVIKEFLGW